MNDLNDRYLTLAQWNTYVEPVRKALKDANLDRLKQQVTDWAGKPPRMRGLKGLQRPILSRKRRPGHMKYMRRLVHYWYVKQDAKDEPKVLNLREYAAARLLRIARVLGTYKQFGSTIGGETKWVPGRDLEAVLNGDRTPATVGKVLGLVDWFQHCLAAVEQAEQPIKAKSKEPAQRSLQREQRTEVKFRNEFTSNHADKIAFEVELIDKEGNYRGVPGKRVSRLCGFYWRLRQEGKVEGSLEALRDFFAERYLKEPITSAPSMAPTAATDMADDVKDALKRLFPTNNPG